MFRLIFKLTVMFCIVSQSFSAQNVRKYNVEEEAFKLYKQDFKSVLKRFRRTTDYLKILQDRLADLKISTREMSLQVLHYFQGKMEKKVMETLPASGTAKQEDQKKSYFRSNSHREAPPPQISEDDWKKISNLDNYNFFYSHLTVPERNTLKEMGFSFAGQVIHSIINNLKSGNNEDEKFTKLPFGDDIINKFTTVHPEEHKWQIIAGDSTKHQSAEKKDEAPPPADDAFKFRASDVQMNVNLTTVKKEAIPTNTYKGATKPRATNSWNRPMNSGFSEPTPTTRKIVTSIVTFGL